MIKKIYVLIIKTFLNKCLLFLEFWKLMTLVVVGFKFEKLLNVVKSNSFNLW